MLNFSSPICLLLFNCAFIVCFKTCFAVLHIGVIKNDDDMMMGGAASAQTTPSDANPC